MDRSPEFAESGDFERPVAAASEGRGLRGSARGHGEGYDDTHKQVFKRFYKRVADPGADVEYPTFVEGMQGMEKLEKVLESSQLRAWVDV